jgi:hypothetical protein
MQRRVCAPPDPEFLQRSRVLRAVPDRINNLNSRTSYRIDVTVGREWRDHHANAV